MLNIVTGLYFMIAPIDPSQINEAKSIAREAIDTSATRDMIPAIRRVTTNGGSSSIADKFAISSDQCDRLLIKKP